MRRFIIRIPKNKIRKITYGKPPFEERVTELLRGARKKVRKNEFIYFIYGTYEDERSGHIQNAIERLKKAKVKFKCFKLTPSEIREAIDPKFRY